MDEQSFLGLMTGFDERCGRVADRIMKDLVEVVAIHNRLASFGERVGEGEQDDTVREFVDRVGRASDRLAVAVNLLNGVDEDA